MINKGIYLLFPKALDLVRSLTQFTSMLSQWGMGLSPRGNAECYMDIGCQCPTQSCERGRCLIPRPGNVIPIRGTGLNWVTVPIDAGSPSPSQWVMRSGSNLRSPGIRVKQEVGGCCCRDWVTTICRDLGGSRGGAMSFMISMALTFPSCTSSQGSLTRQSLVHVPFCEYFRPERVCPFVPKFYKFYKGSTLNPVPQPENFVTMVRLMCKYRIQRVRVTLVYTQDQGQADPAKWQITPCHFLLSSLTCGQHCPTPHSKQAGGTHCKTRNISLFGCLVGWCWFAVRKLLLAGW
jgi:hypothetical protein